MNRAPVSPAGLPHDVVCIFGPPAAAHEKPVPRCEIYRIVSGASTRAAGLRGSNPQREPSVPATEDLAKGFGDIVSVAPRDRRR